MGKLLILPGGFDFLGGTLISLLSLAKGFELCGASKQLCIIVWSGSLTEKCLQEAGYDSCLHSIKAKSQYLVMRSAFAWINQQPPGDALLLDNCVARSLMPLLVLASAKLRSSDRQVFHFCHDLALSRNPLGFLMRKMAFSCISPSAICNSFFTAQHISTLIPDIQGVLYQPVDFDRFNATPRTSLPPLGLEPIIKSGAKIILMPSRINKPGIINDKNIRAIIPVLSYLKKMGHFYHGVVVGPDQSNDGSYAYNLLETAQKAGVADRFTILPPSFVIEEYYKHSDIVVSLAPREPFGRTVVEAIACGVPVVGSRTGGTGEILGQFAPEWTITPEHPVDIAKTIVYTMSSSHTQDVLVKGRNWVRSHCNLKAYAQGMMIMTGLDNHKLV
ncbi:MAG: glycosyltransferase family 4 protein [Mastigocoleus sp.]